MNSMRRRIIITVSVVVILIVFSLITEVIFSFNDTEYTITVTDKERVNIRYSSRYLSSKYLVFGDDEDGNSLVFENTDCLFRGKWNSSNIQGQMKEGNKYKITVIGFRIPFFSQYQNIIKIEEIAAE